MKENLENLGLTLILIKDCYDYLEKNIQKISMNSINKFFEFYPKDNINLEKDFCNYATSSIENIIGTSLIVNMYHTFEQFIKITFKISDSNFWEKFKEICKKYDYNVEENSYYETCIQYKNITNSVKHGKICKDLNKYPSGLVITDDELGTLLNNPFNITNKEIDECFCTLFGFANEMYFYFETLGYLEIK